MNGTKKSEEFKTVFKEDTLLYEQNVEMLALQSLNINWVHCYISNAVSSKIQ